VAAGGSPRSSSRWPDCRRLGSPGGLQVW
jgi:hypothetical protein